MICIEFLDLQRARGHSVGSRILPRSSSTVTECPQTLHLKKACFMSGMTGVVRMTSPLMEMSLSMSDGFRSRRLVDLSRPHGRTRYCCCMTWSSRFGSCCWCCCWCCCEGRGVDGASPCSELWKVSSEL